MNNIMPPEHTHPLINHAQGSMPAGSKRGRFIQFYKKAVLMRARSKEEGRPIHEERDFVKIISGPGHIVDREVKNEYDPIVQEYYSVWQAYKQDRTDFVDGTRLEDYPSLSVAQIENLKALRIYTVEQLADATDNLKQTMGPGAGALVDAAKAWLGRVEQHALVSQQAEKIRELELNMEAMKRVFEENLGKSIDTSLADENAKLKAEIERLQSKPKRGKPRKEQSEE